MRPWFMHHFILFLLLVTHTHSWYMHQQQIGANWGQQIFSQRAEQQTSHTRFYFSCTFCEISSNAEHVTNTLSFSLRHKCVESFLKIQLSSHHLTEPSKYRFLCISKYVADFLNCRYAHVQKETVRQLKISRKLYSISYWVLSILTVVDFTET